MTMSFRRRLGAGLLGLALAAPPLAGAQPNPYNLKYRTGQTVQPIFEGWSRKADGGFTMHFGYFNRNFVEEVHVPVGPDNHFDDPGLPDAGQPTFFYPRAHRRVFSIDVPSDFGDRRLVWNLTTQGETLRAIGWLEPTWETAARAAGGRRLSPEAARNTAPEIGVDVPAAVTLQDGATLVARVTDDGLPVVREIDPNRPRRGSNDPPHAAARPRRHRAAAQRAERAEPPRQRRATAPRPRSPRVLDRLAGTRGGVVRAGPDRRRRGRTGNGDGGVHGARRLRAQGHRQRQPADHRARRRRHRPVKPVFCRSRSALASLATRDSSTKSLDLPDGSTEPWTGSRRSDTGFGRTRGDGVMVAFFNAGSSHDPGLDR